MKNENMFHFIEKVYKDWVAYLSDERDDWTIQDNARMHRAIVWLAELINDNLDREPCVVAAGAMQTYDLIEIGLSAKDVDPLTTPTGVFAAMFSEAFVNLYHTLQLCQQQAMILLGSESQSWVEMPQVL